MNPDLHRARWLTTHFFQLQGLRLVPIGLFFLVAGAGYLSWTPWIDFVGDKRPWGMGEVLFIALLFLLFFVINRHYREHYGKVVPGTHSPGWRLGLGIGIVASALVVMFFVDVPVNVFLFVLGMMIGFKGINGSGRRGPLILGMIVVAFSFWELFFGTNWLLFRQIFIPTLGLGFIIMGVLDHIRFVQLMQLERTNEA